MRPHLTVVGGGLAGLTAAIAAAEQGMAVTLYEAHRTLGGRARSTSGPYVANDGTHAFYADGEPFRWLAERHLVQPYRKPSGAELRRVRLKHGGTLHRLPPADLLRALSRRGVRAPVDEDFGSWAGRRFGESAARAAGALVGVVTYEADPGRLSAAFVWERVLRAAAARLPAIRYAAGGWGAVIDRMAARARELGVAIETGTRVDALPEPPVIVATSLPAARQLLGDSTLRWESGHAVLLDLGLVADPRDPFLVCDLDDGGFLTRQSMPLPDLAPPGHSLVQLEMPARRDEPSGEAARRIEGLADLGLPGWRDRVTWRRDATAYGRTGALDLPGTTWRDRPAVDRGDGVWLVGDCVAAPGLLSEVSMNSAVAAASAAATVSLGRIAAGDPA